MIFLTQKLFLTCNNYTSMNGRKGRGNIHSTEKNSKK